MNSNMKMPNEYVMPSAARSRQQNPKIKKKLVFIIVHTRLITEHRPTKVELENKIGRWRMIKLIENGCLNFKSKKSRKIIGNVTETDIKKVDNLIKKSVNDDRKHSLIF